MNMRVPAILVAARAHGETAVIARFLTEEYGIVAGYVAGGRGRQLRPVMIPGNTLDVEIRARDSSQLPFARAELVASRAALMTEPLPAAAIAWACALSASALPERNPYPALYAALAALLEAIASAPSARGWLAAMVLYEALVLREMGYGGERPDLSGDVDTHFQAFRALHRPLRERLVEGRARDVMAARVVLGERLARMIA